MVFKRNKDYYAELKMEKDGYWVAQLPLFISGDKGLFPVFKNGGPHGRFPVNHQEFIMKDLIERKKWDI